MKTATDETTPAAGAFKFDPEAVYSVEFLERALAGITTPRAMLDALGVRRRLKAAVFGRDILAALERVATEPQARTAPVEVIRTGRPGRPRKVPVGLEPFDLADLRREG